MRENQPSEGVAGSGDWLETMEQETAEELGLEGSGGAYIGLFIMTTALCEESSAEKLATGQMGRTATTLVLLHLAEIPPLRSGQRDGVLS